MRQHFYPGLEIPPSFVPRFLIEAELENIPRIHYKKQLKVDDSYVPAVTVVGPPPPATFVHTNFVFNMEVLKKRRVRFDQDKQPSDINTAKLAIPPLRLDHVTYSNLNPPPIHGELNTENNFIGTYEPSNDVMTPTTSTYLIPIIIPYDIFIKELGVFISSNVSAGSDSALRLGIYSIERGVPEQLLQENIASARTLGYRGLEMNLHVPSGAYALAFITNTTIDIRKAQVNFSLLGSIFDDWIIPYTCWTWFSPFSYVTGLLDPPPSDMVLSTVDVPRILARIG